MPRLVSSAVILTFGVVVAGCVYVPPPPVFVYNPYDPGQRAVAGSLLGASAGAAFGAIAGGGQGAAIGALTGGAVGAAVGASTAPELPYPYGY